MKSNIAVLNLGLSLVVGALVLFATRLESAESSPIRLAVGPFFAPAGNTKLESATGLLPDLLTAELSRGNHFQLVERDKVDAIWKEMHLAEAGLTSADTVIKMGRILSCDWLVTGSFFQTESGMQIWVKVINTQNSVVLDLQNVSYNRTNLSATTKAIADFLGKAQAHSQPAEFIALGKFDDMGVATSRENWAPRLVALIEKHFIAAGYGVVEREAVAPIFSEYQFQTAGLTAGSTNHVKLKPAFWIVDGGCKWFRDTQDKLSVTIRVQKMGAGEQMFSFTKLPGEEVEKAVVETIQSALANTGSMTMNQAQAGEEKVRVAHLEDLAKGRGETPQINYTPQEAFITITDAYGGKRQLTVDPAFLAQQASHAHEMLKTLQQAILLNPHDMHAKWMLGRSWFGSNDTTENKHGQELIEEVAASSDPTYSMKAKNWLADFESGRLTYERDQFGNRNLVPHGQPTSIPTNTVTPAQAAKNLAAWVAKVNEVTNLATRSSSVAKIPSSLLVSGQFDDITATKLWKRNVLIACGTNLKSYDLDSMATRAVNLPLKLTNPITAIETDNANLWLGTSGGLIRVALVDGTAKVYGEKDGFPTPSITSLRLAGGQLFVGFGSQNGGALGYMDTTTGKFTGLMSSAHLRRPWSEAVLNPPEMPIASITTLDGNSVWISSPLALQNFNFRENKWSLATPPELNDLFRIGVLSGNLIAINSKYLVVQQSQRCIAICRLPAGQWRCLNIATNLDGDLASSVATDPVNPDFLWIGGSHGQVTLLNMATSQIIAQGNIPSSGMVERIFATVDKVLFIAGGELSGSDNVHCLNKATLFGANPNAAAAQSGLNPRDEFLQHNFSKFVPVDFQKEASGGALIQHLQVNRNLFMFGTSFYCGFKFTMPAWLDGDFRWLNLLDKTEAQKDFSAHSLTWGIIPLEGQSISFEGADRHNLGSFPELQQQFPFTHTIFTEELGLAQLKPGKTYGIWFCFEDRDLPDIGFSMTIDSAKGTDEFGELPLH